MDNGALGSGNTSPDGVCSAFHFESMQSSTVAVGISASESRSTTSVSCPSVTVPIVPLFFIWARSTSNVDRTSSVA
ncbi:hypothetical protein GA0115254_121010 [Streptomyces sp. Ncost-T10-10d]|nr:hypothetical protein GA0115254_121010 [Streptomyces sp. Ncost-T10-10d]